MKRLSLLALLAFLGCTKILGVDYDYRLAGDSTTTGTTSGTGGTASGPCGRVWDALPACEGCVESKCCVPLKKCDVGHDCGALTDCVNACDPKDVACLTVCVNDDKTQNQSQGAIDYGALTYCVALHCAAVGQCSFPICGTSFNAWTRPCADCLNADAGCCAKFNACAEDSVCANCLLVNWSAPACASNTAWQDVLACQTGDGCGRECSFAICGDLEYPGYASARCNYCLSAPGGCCAEFQACRADADCDACIGTSPPASCDSNAKMKAYYACMNSNCYAQCSGI